MKQILVVGCPRSGTTLLQAVLSSHKEIASIPETHFFPSLCSKFGLVRILGLSTTNAEEIYLSCRINSLIKTLDQVFLQKQLFVNT